MFQGVLIWMNFRMEELKDGKAESIKYNSIKLQVNTPNKFWFSLMKTLIKKECRKIDGLFISLE